MEVMSDPAGRWTQWPPSESERDTGGGGLLAEGLEANVNEQTTCLGCLTSWGRKGEGIALYSLELYFHRQSHPQLSVVFALVPSLHSFWS